MWTKQLRARLDDGPIEILFESANAAARGLKSCELLVTVLPFVEQFKNQVQELEELMNEFEAFAPEVKAVSCMLSVGKFVYNSNKIDFTGLPTEEETAELLHHGKVAFNTAQRQVVSTANLMERTYSVANFRCEDFEKLGFTPESLKIWHACLCANSFYDCGQFRPGFAFTHDEDSIRKHPNHSLIPHALLSLGHLVRKLCRATTSEFGGWSARILYAFGIAAFVQFHLVDIHPFFDGNGSLARFTSKRILDWVCRLPLPQFADRDVYLNALSRGRSRGALAAPQDLMELLLDTAIKHFRQIRDSFGNPSYPQPYTFICCPASTIEQELSEQRIPSEAMAFLKAAFETLEVSKCVELQLECGLFVLKKWPEIEVS